MNNIRYLSKLIAAIKHNEKGDLLCYLRRLAILPAIVMQKLKKNKLVRIPVFNGGRMYVITNEIVSRILIAFGYAEPEIIAVMLDRMKEGSVFVDIGTHYGFEALIGSGIVGETGRVYCFEPNPGSFRIAEMNLTANNISLHNLAVGEEEGTLNMNAYDIYNSAMNSVTDNTEFVPNPWIPSKNGKIITVNVVKLDSFLKDRPKPVDFIKCDVEGFEAQVIRGAAGLIKADKPIIILEADYRLDGKISVRAESYKELMETLDYTAFDFEFTDSALKIGKLGAFPVGHPNILFMPN